MMVIIGSDHTGIIIKNEIIEYLKTKKIPVFDATNMKDQTADDYPDRAVDICKKVLEDKKNIGIAICGTGVGISIACNKIQNIRAALCSEEYISYMARKHNDANVLCLGARASYAKDISNIYKIVDAFINTEFEGGRHQRRIDKISDIENARKG